ncbi:MAG: hypothetical protein RL748_1923, partial [Pseudomonadota bacterium]
MTAIVSGNGLGLSNSSSATLGQRGSFGSFGSGRNGEQVAVNIATGNLVLQNQDDFLVSHGTDIATVRTYNSQGQDSFGSGGAWFNYSNALHLRLNGAPNSSGSSITRYEADGAVSDFLYDATAGHYVSSAGGGAFDTIVATVDGFTWVDGSSRASAQYNGSGTLISSSDRTGNRLDYSYDTNNPNLLRMVSDAFGGSTRYDYQGNLLSEIHTISSQAGGRDQTRVRYHYDGSNRLDRVTVDLSPQDNSVSDGNVYVTEYTYDGASHRLASISQSDGSSLAFTWQYVNSAFRVATISDALGRKTTYTYATNITHVSGSNGVQSYEYDQKGQLTRSRTGLSQLDFSYFDNGDVQQISEIGGIDGRTRVTTFGYDSNGNAISQTDNNGSIINRVFDGKNQLISEKVTLDSNTRLITRN